MTLQFNRFWIVLAVSWGVLISAVPPASSQTTTTYKHLTWLLRKPKASPTARESHAMAYDPIRQKIVMFGGFDGQNYLSDTWLYDGANWRKLPSVGPYGPDGRAAATMVFDNASQQLILFGGYNGQYLSDTWTFNEKSLTWEQARPAVVPVAVTAPNSFQDPVNGHAEIFGGFDGRFYSARTYQWTGSDWILLEPAMSPLARGAAIAANDARHHQVVLFGGLADLNSYNTWLWDGTTWALANPTRQPFIHYDGGSAYEPHLGYVIAFGGGNGGPQLTDTWKWTGKTWLKVPTATTPYGRESFGMAYDEKLGRIVIFGGLYNNLVLNDTWVAVPAP